jgi:hypothetical protein
VLLGSTAVIMSTTDMKISANYKAGTQAFYEAEAGVEQVIYHLRNNPVILPTAINQTKTITISVPTDFSFDTEVTLHYVAPNRYRFQMTGFGTNNTSKTIEARIKTTPLYPVSPDGAVAMYGFYPQIALKEGANPQENYSIDGQDYPVPSNPNCNGNACSMSADTTKTALPGLYTFHTPVITGTSTYLNGNPDSLKGDNTGSEWIDFVTDVISKGLSTPTMGTRAEPAITLVPSGQTLAGTYNGAGIIIVEDGGELQLAGNGCFEGIIILRGSGTVTGVGTNNVYGSIITIDHLKADHRFRRRQHVLQFCSHSKYCQHQ